MGLCYQTGHGVGADSLKAVQLYQRSIKDGNKALFIQNQDLAKKGNLFSNMLIASCYQKGIGVDKDPDKAITYLTTAANKNCTDAQRDLGLLLLNEKKAMEAAQWFKKGADNGDVVCTFYYGKMLVEGLGVKTDKKGGANYLLKAAEAGFPQAMYYVGNCYMNGDGLTKNADQSVRWYKLAAGKGVHNAQWALAQCYREGVGTHISYDQALYWYAQAASKGHNRAFKNLVTDSIPDSPFVSYLKGMKSYTSKDFENALKQFKILQKSNIEDGKIMEAVIIANSGYPKQNIKKGVKILTEAAKTNPQAMYLLGALYEAGKGVDKDMSTAISYLTKSAEMGYGPAECSLADIYYEGRGTGQDYTKAVEWYSKAYAQGQLNENAAKRYAACYENGWGGLTPDKEYAEILLKDDFKSNISDLLKNIYF